MKVHVEVDLTPEEARRAVGLPDLTPVHDRYIAILTDAMEHGVKPEMLEAMVRNWSPVGEAQLGFWRRMFDGTTSSSD